MAAVPSQAGQAVKAQIASFDARHGAAVFLTLFALAGLDIMAMKEPAAAAKATQAWVAWGTVFILLGFFVIGPEQDVRMARAASH